MSHAALMCTRWFAFHEPIMLRQVLGVAIIMTGIALIGMDKKSAR